MKFEKIIVTLGFSVLILAMSHSALAAKNNLSSDQPSVTAKKSLKSSNQKIAKRNAHSMTRRMTKQKFSQKRKTSLKKTSLKNNQFKVASINNPVKAEAALSNIKLSPTQNTSTAKLSKIAKPAKAETSGSVNFTVGNDSNIDPDKINKFHGTFFQIDPTLNIKSGGLSASFGAMIKDYKDTTQSDTFKQNEANASLGYNFKMSESTSLTSTLSGLYHDEKWPDYFNFPGTEGVDPADNTLKNMPIRYAETKLDEKLTFDLGQVKTAIGGYALHRDALSIFTDFAPDILAEKIYQKDYNQFSAYGEITYAAASFLDLTLKPSVKQTKYTEREGRQPDGSAGGLTISAPLYELITSELELNTAFKFYGSNIVPKFIVGQVADQALGAEDQAYGAVGISAELLLDKDTKLTLAPNFMFKKTSYDNWTKGTPAGEKRFDNDASTGIKASMMFSKNIGASLSYDKIYERSNLDDSSENYKEEIVSTSLNLVF